ncbi:XTP/dITP diphosphatase [Calderihabitans maritimus]|uniref:dITP/XTP pyrophosphatase n=1 Tax=Calderihabitans maritimus TaxID=1246530 RepID=A0A1Z5HPH1_9FIRM|nr:XTP/dITP diphosphatase [Calderihabitans maritimus]GAW91277.1 hypothetical protein KKC1_04390 [Calderihabitans maritimus]
MPEARPNRTSIVIASKNEGKLREFKELMSDLPVEILSLKDFSHLPPIEESGQTFEENALIKARAVAQKTGLIAMADDSGLEVDYLRGEPGVRSARFAGEPADDARNIEKLLSLLEGVPLSDRTARFRCVIAIVTARGTEYVTEGVCEGLIALSPEGDKGFGYDPVFYLPQYGKTMAQLDLKTKNLISHRAKAFRQAAEIICKLL